MIAMPDFTACSIFRRRTRIPLGVHCAGEAYEKAFDKASSRAIAVYHTFHFDVKSTLKWSIPDEMRLILALSTNAGRFCSPCAFSGQGPQGFRKGKTWEAFNGGAAPFKEPGFHGSRMMPSASL